MYRKLQPVTEPAPEEGPDVVRVKYDYTRFIKSLGIDVTIPKGFPSDLASVPWIFRWRIKPTDLKKAAPIIHDYLYRHQKINKRRVTRAEADRAFRDIMREDEVWK